MSGGSDNVVKRILGLSRACSARTIYFYLQRGGIGLVFVVPLVREYRVQNVQKPAQSITHRRNDRRSAQMHLQGY